MKKLFGTDGIRGQANRHPMTPEVALSLGEAIAFYFAKRGGGRIVIGKDTRRSSYMFEYALSAGISSMGAQAILTGPLPTPGIAFLTRAMRADAGVVISASHNPFSDNGIKFFDQDGYKLPDELELHMEEFLFSNHGDSIKPTGENIGRAIRIEDAVGRYTEFLKSTFPRHLNLNGLKIVIDCANGAGYSVGPMLLSEMGATVIPMGVEPNGININDQCGALHPEGMAMMVKKTGAHLGIALDGDADRVILADEKGNIIDGDQILAMCAMALKSSNRLKKKTVVGTIMSNMGLEIYLKENGIQLVRTSVGDRYIVEQMRKKKYSLGGEPSGHLIFMDISTTGDGLVAALQVLALMQIQKKPVSELSRTMEVFPQKIVNIPIQKRRDLETIAPIKKELDAVRKKLGKRGRVVLRYSGTELLLRLMVESEDEALMNQCVATLKECIAKNLP